MKQLQSVGVSWYRLKLHLFHLLWIWLNCLQKFHNIWPCSVSGVGAKNCRTCPRQIHKTLSNLRLVHSY